MEIVPCKSCLDDNDLQKVLLKVIASSILLCQINFAFLN